MAYSTTELILDLQTQATTLHLGYRRAKFLLDRWNSGLSALIENDGTDYGGVAGVDIHNLINRCSELIADYELTSNAKLNTVLELSDLQLPDLE